MAPQDPPMTIGQAIDQAMKQRDLSQSEAAEQIGISQQVLSRWIAGAYPPKPSYVPAIARFLRLPQSEVRVMRDAAAHKREPVDRAELDRIEAKIDDLTRLVEQALGRRPGPR